MSSAKKSVRRYAASFSKPYSWCKPPRVGLAVTRYPMGTLCRCGSAGTLAWDGSGIPGVLRKYSIRHHATSFSSQYSWCSPPRIGVDMTR